MWPSPAAPPLIHYHDELISSPRIYQEQLASMASSYKPGVIFVTPDANVNGPTTIHFLGTTNQVAWPGWNAVRWRFDGQIGALLGVDHTAFGSGIYYQQMIAGADGSLWWFGALATVYHGGPMQIDPATLAEIGTTSPYPVSSFLDKHGNNPIDIQDFSIDRGRDRFFVRWSTDYVGEIEVYELSTRTYLTSIYAPNETNGVVLTHDGYIYLVDKADWISVYDYAGNSHGSFRNPRRQNYVGGYGGIVYGWDRYYKRLLFLGGIQDAADGACKCRIWGYYPVPDAAGVTAPVPRQAPRHGRRVYVFSHAYGEGGEALASRGSTATGLDVVSGVTDQDGDAILSLTGGTPGSLSVSIAVDVNTTPADTAETDPAAIVGRTLQLTMNQPATVTQSSPPSYAHTSPIPCQVTIGSNGVSPYTAVFSFDTGSLAHVEVSVSGAGPVLSTTVTLGIQTWNVAVVVTDSAGTPNHGQASKQGGIGVT